MEKEERLRIMEHLLTLLGTGESQSRTYSAEDWWIINKIAFLISASITPDGEIEIL